tara:strand:- start:149 stop:499 length:351 start_codon:yes stop_codon:yes gene_type:complete
MKIINKHNPLIKTQFFVCLVLCISFIFANTNPSATSNSKPSATDINNFNEKTKLEKKEKGIENSSNDNFHEIMSTKGGCTASCCAGTNTVQKVDSSKKKSNSQKGKKKFGWFSWSK